jgi:hypothetical protein
MTPRVFALQFLDGHHYAEYRNAADRNIHRKALGAVGILLSERPDLVRQFFSKPTLEAPDIDSVIALVYTEHRYGETPPNPARCIGPVKSGIALSLNCRIRDEDMILLAECANHSAFFKDMIDAATISDLLHCRLAVPLVADNLMGLAYFLDQLSAMHLVGRNWQTTLERCGTILLQGEDKPQKHANYASALSRARRSGCFRGVDVIDATLAHIINKKQ